VDDRTICSVPPQWTDIAAPDPEVLMGKGRALFRVADLVELTRLVTHLSSEKGSEVPVGCKDKSAARVKLLCRNDAAEWHIYPGPPAFYRSVPDYSP